MKFKYDDLHDSILNGETDEELDLYLIEEGEWMQDSKYQNKDTIFKHKGKFYIIAQTRSGSPFSEWHYEEHEVDKNGYIYCDEVERVEIKTYEWHCI